MIVNERPADGICVNVPDESSVVTVASCEAFAVEIENGHRVVYLRPDDARRVINSGLPCCVPWREANMALAERLGPMPKPTHGINLAQLHMAQWQAVRPLSIVEEVARMPGPRGSRKARRTNTSHRGHRLGGIGTLGCSSRVRVRKCATPPRNQTFPLRYDCMTAIFAHRVSAERLGLAASSAPD